MDLALGEVYLPCILSRDYPDSLLPLVVELIDSHYLLIPGDFEVVQLHHIDPTVRVEQLIPNQLDATQPLGDLDGLHTPHIGHLPDAYLSDIVSSDHQGVLLEGVDAGNDRSVSPQDVLQLYVEKGAFHRVDGDSVMVPKRDQALRQFIVMQCMATSVS